jgi:hypothetical protein
MSLHFGIALDQEQFLRDQYSEINREQLGLVFYARLNKARC